MIEKENFVNYKKQKERDKEKTRVFPIRFNKDEISNIEKQATILSEYKLTTTIKLLIELGSSVLQREETITLLEARVKNDRRNIKKGVEHLEPNFWKL
jgi:hypothetical protein